MSDDSEQVTALIKALLILNRAKGPHTIEPPIGEELEGRQAKRTRIRQELVEALHLRNKEEVLICSHSLS